VKGLLRALPDMARLITRLVSDPGLPRPVKIALAAAAVFAGSVISPHEQSRMKLPSSVMNLAPSGR